MDLKTAADICRPLTPEQIAQSQVDLDAAMAKLSATVDEHMAEHTALRAAARKLVAAFDDWFDEDRKISAPLDIALYDLRRALQKVGG